MKRITTLMVAPAIALAATQAQAQETPTNTPETPNSVRFGINRLTDGDTGDRTGRTGFQLGLSREIGSAGRIDLDFSRQSERDNDIQTGGLSYVHKFPFGSDGRFYGGLGVGVFHVSVDARNSGAGFDESKVVLGGKVLVGYQFNQRFFAEAAYNLLGKVDGANPSSISLVAGIKF
jgi:hypothetical protein